MIEERWEKTNNINSLAYKAGNIAARSGENDVIVNRQVWLNRASCIFIVPLPLSSFVGGLPGILVPRATKPMAVTESLSPILQPRCEAKSPITAVRTPMPAIETTKAT
jgi:hypothetical protein